MNNHTWTTAKTGFWLVAALPACLLTYAGLGTMLGFELNVSTPGFFIFLLIGQTYFGYWWGRRQAELANLPNPTSAGWTAGLTLALVFSLSAWQIDHAERVSLDLILLRTGQPVHIVFAMLFTPVTLLVAGLTAASLGLADRRPRLALKLFINTGGSAALIFFAVWLIGDMVGYRIGAPGAEQRATMLTVMFVGMWLAALVGSAVTGKTLMAAPNRSNQS